MVAFFDFDVTGWQGVHQAFQIREFLADGIMMSAQNLTPSMLAGVMPGYGRGLGELMADYNRIVTAGPLIEDTGTGRVRNLPGLGTQVFYRVTEKDADRVVRGVELTAEALFAAGARRIVLPFNGAPVVRDPGDLRRLLARPVPRRSIELYSIHLMGTARMSEDPRRGVVDSFGAFHGVRGLFVCDASVFPGPIGINPMETVIALAMRNARRLIEQRGRYCPLTGTRVSARWRPGCRGRTQTPRWRCPWAPGSGASSRCRTRTPRRSRPCGRWGWGPRWCRRR